MRAAPFDQRRTAIVLALALCVWLFAYSTHVHAGIDSSSTHPVSHCDLCMARPSSAAPPPAEIIAPVPSLIEIAAPASVVAVIITRGVPSSYLSRAPPAL